MLEFISEISLCTEWATVMLLDMWRTGHQRQCIPTINNFLILSPSMLSTEKFEVYFFQFYLDKVLQMVAVVTNTQTLKRQTFDHAAYFVSNVLCLV